MHYLWSDEQKQVTLNNDGSTPITSFCHYGQKIYAIRDSRLVCFNLNSIELLKFQIVFNCEDGAESTVSSSIEFIQVSANYGQMFAISRANELFVFDAKSADFQPLNVLSSGHKCKHGTQLQ